LPRRTEAFIDDRRSGVGHASRHSHTSEPPSGPTPASMRPQRQSRTRTRGSPSPTGGLRGKRLAADLASKNRRRTPRHPSLSGNHGNAHAAATVPRTRDHVIVCRW
jgi:hypothetical protein